MSNAEDNETSPGLERACLCSPEHSESPKEIPTTRDEILAVARVIIADNMVQSTLFHMQMTLYDLVYKQFRIMDPTTLNILLVKLVTEAIEAQTTEIADFVTAGDSHDF